MGAPLSKPVEDWTLEEVANVVEASGTDPAYQSYGEAVRAGGVCGLVLATPGEVEETLDDLSIKVKLHRRVLTKKWQAYSGQTVAVTAAAATPSRKRRATASSSSANKDRKTRTDKGAKNSNRGKTDDRKCVKNFFWDLYQRDDFQRLVAPDTGLASLPLNALAELINDRYYGGDRKNVYKMHRSLNLVDALWDAGVRECCVYRSFESEEAAKEAFLEIDDWIRRACHVYCGVNPTTVEPNPHRNTALTGVGNLFSRSPELLQEIEDCLPDWSVAQPSGVSPPIREKVMAKETELGKRLAAQQRGGAGSSSSTLQRGGGQTGGRKRPYQPRNRNKNHRII